MMTATSSKFIAVSLVALLFLGCATTRSEVSGQNSLASVTPLFAPPLTGSGPDLLTTQSFSPWESQVNPSYSNAAMQQIAASQSTTNFGLTDVYPSIAENGSYYGEISEETGRPKTVYVRGHYRDDGTYVRSHYRSRPIGTSQPISGRSYTVTIRGDDTGSGTVNLDPSGSFNGIICSLYGTFSVSGTVTSGGYLNGISRQGFLTVGTMSGNLDRFGGNGTWRNTFSGGFGTWTAM